MNRRRFVAAAAANVAASHLDLLGLSKGVDAMSSVLTAAETGAEHSPVRPFRVQFSDSELSDLRRRVQATRWPERETVRDTTQGVQLATMNALARYWATEHDWRKCEAKLNSF